MMMVPKDLDESAGHSASSVTMPLRFKMRRNVCSTINYRCSRTVQPQGRTLFRRDSRY